MRLLSVMALAAICHTANRAYCQEVGDDSQPKWDNAPAWQRESAVNGVKFHLDNPGASPSASHENWLKEKEAAGWKYGPEKNADKKEHPCCLPYDELPKGQKAKDYLFIAVVHALAPMVDQDALDGEAAAVGAKLGDD